MQIAFHRNRSEVWLNGDTNRVTETLLAFKKPQYPAGVPLHKARRSLISIIEVNFVERIKSHRSNQSRWQKIRVFFVVADVSPGVVLYSWIVL